ncbi:Uncharacterized protein TCM_027231 [Theobroma cacao]|uniref:Uncharacterized protein n=1 Tax=Theobroma cacao TaxID=3641 RepID=A0A061GFN9_THECC|nr:Uncharacterized protein TCM_027231 [Theobroma cacao]
MKRKVQDHQRGNSWDTRKVERLFELVFFHLPMQYVSVASIFSSSLYQWYLFLCHALASNYYILYFIVGC